MSSAPSFKNLRGRGAISDAKWDFPFWLKPVWTKHVCLLEAFRLLTAGLEPKWLRVFGLWRWPAVPGRTADQQAFVSLGATGGQRSVTQDSGLACSSSSPGKKPFGGSHDSLRDAPQPRQSIMAPGLPEDIVHLRDQEFSFCTVLPEDRTATRWRRFQP